MRRGQIYEALRNREAARTQYRLAAEIWAHADAELAPEVTLLKTRLAALR